MTQWTPLGLAVFYGIPLIPVSWCVYRGYRRRQAPSSLDGSPVSFMVLAAMFAFPIVFETVVTLGPSVIPAIMLVGATAIIFGPVFVVRGLLERAWPLWIEAGALLVLAVLIDGVSVLSLLMGGAA